MILSRRQFEAACVAMGAGIVAMSPHAPLAFTIGMVVLLVIRVALRRRQIGALARVPRFVLMAAVLILSIAQFGTILGQKAGPIVLSAFLTLKLFETETRRDALVLSGGLCFLIMSLFLFDQGLVQVILAFAALLVLLRTLLVMQPESTVADRLDLHAQWRAQFKTSAGFALGAIPFAVAAFVLFPRFSSPLWGSPDQFNQAKTGINDSMEPGQFSALSLDDTPAFRVRFEGNQPPPPAQRYWRGPVLWNYDGQRWNTSRIFSTMPALPEELISRGKPLRYQVSLEKGYKRYLYALDMPTQGPTGSGISRDRQLFNREAVMNVIRYDATSTLEYTLAPTLSHTERRMATSLINGHEVQAQALAQSWREQFNDDPEKIIRAALTLYNREFSYSLDPEPLVGNRMDDFLFRTKTGYCEHFSASFVILMRSAGIPARVVTGYLGGIWIPRGPYLLVANSDAHAWAEVWLEGRGWVRIDPTAAVAPERINRGGREFGQEFAPTWARASWLTSLRLNADRVRAWWNDTVVEFNSAKQINVLEKINLDATDWRKLGLTLLVMGILSVSLPLIWLRWRERQQRDPLHAAYLDFCSRLAKVGVPRFPHEPPFAYAARACAQLPIDAEKIHALSQRYVFLRYDLASLNDSEAGSATVGKAELGEWLAQIKQFQPRPVIHLKTKDGS